MDTASARLLPCAIALGAVGLLAGCVPALDASVPSSPDAAFALASAHPEPPKGEVVATGTVIDVDGTAELCLGGVQESYPPQCVGIPLNGWSWDDVEPDDESSGTRWGAYGMSGRYDGTSFAPMHPPIPLALFDTVARPTMTCDPNRGTEIELPAIQDTIGNIFGPEVLLTSGLEGGCLWVDVVWDDGTLQNAADEDFGVGVVMIRSVLWAPDAE